MLPRDCAYNWLEGGLLDPLRYFRNLLYFSYTLLTPLVKPGTDREREAISSAAKAFVSHRTGWVRKSVKAFADKISAAYPNGVVGTYRWHGGGKWDGQGFSLDIQLPRGSRDQRGFYAVSDTVGVFLKLDKMAKNSQFGWKALYNDRKVAEVVNKKFGRRAVRFVAQHGPAPYVLHIHLDLMPLKPPGGK